MFRTILVPLDGSELAEQALEYARRLALDLGSALILLRVVSSSDYPGPQAFTKQPVEPADSELAVEGRLAGEYLTLLAGDLRRSGLDATSVVRAGEPAGEIVEYCQGAGADLIVMSTHGRSGLSRWVYGSVADRVLRGATVPVLLVRAGQRPPGETDVAAPARQPAPTR